MKQLWAPCAGSGKDVYDYADPVVANGRGQCPFCGRTFLLRKHAWTRRKSVVPRHAPASSVLLARKLADER